MKKTTINATVHQYRSTVRDSQSLLDTGAHDFLSVCKIGADYDITEVTALCNALYAEMRGEFWEYKGAGQTAAMRGVMAEYRTAHDGLSKRLKAAKISVKWLQLKADTLQPLTISTTAEAAAVATTEREDKTKIEAAALAAARVDSDQRHAESIKKLTIDELAISIEEMISLSDHTPEAVLAVLINRYSDANPERSVWSKVA